MPLSKNVDVRPFVRSMNWSTMTKSPGAMPSFIDPTALTLTRCVAPSFFSAQTFARESMRCGAIRCPRPWRGDPVPAPVAGQEQKTGLAEPALDDLVAGRSVGGLDACCLHVGEAGNLVKPTSADHREHVLRTHPKPLTLGVRRGEAIPPAGRASRGKPARRPRST